MTSKRKEAMRKQMAEAAARVEAREAREGAPKERQDVPVAAIQAQQLSKNVYEQLDTTKAENAALKERLAAIDSPGAAMQIDPNLVDVQGFNRLFSSLDPKLDPDFALFCENIRVFGGNKQPAMVRPSPTSPGRYDLVFGERRMRACQIVGAPFTAIVTEIGDDELMLLRELENVGRKDKSLIERAFSLSNLPERLAHGTRDQLLESLKISPATFHRLRKIGEVPLDIWTSIPLPHTTSVREAMAICDAYDTDPGGVIERSKSLDSGLSHTEAVQTIANAGASPDATRSRRVLICKGKRVTVNLNLGSREEALQLGKELEAVLLRFGINLGEDDKDSDTE